MTARIGLFAFALAGFAVFLMRPPTPSSATSPPHVPRPSPLTPLYLGAGSCSAAACHNANAAHGSIGGEFAIWITRDPHAKAYEVLFEERSARIQKNLQRKTPAHQDPQCLRCHVALEYDDQTPPPTAPYFKTDGVSCESCHGRAKHWINVHHLHGWREKSSADKKRLGMNDTRSLVGRAQLCASCHVGAKGMDIDHDLIAAGHPRLHFEFAAFHAHMPRHWPDAKDRTKTDFDARAWLAGQLVTAHAALELLAERAGNQANVWPEFAEFDCASCHHPLQAVSPRQKLGLGTRKPGSLPWGHQVSLTQIALEQLGRGADLRDQLQTLHRLMDAGTPRRADVAAEARKAAAALRLLLDRLDPDLTDANRDFVKLRNQLLTRAKSMPESDERMQVHLGLAAIPPGSAKSLPAPVVHRFDPQAIQARLKER